MEIKKLEKGEIKETKTLFDKIIDELHKEQSEEVKNSYKENYSEKSLNFKFILRDNIYLIAKDNGKVVGFMFGWIFSKVGNIHWIGIDKELRKKGIASKLMEKALDEFKGKDCYKIELYAYPNREDSLKFFKKFGFKEKSLIDKNFCGISVLYMDLELRKPTQEEYTKKIMIAGEAGQGIKLITRILAKILSKLDKEVSLNLVYGPSVRSGNMHAEFIYSDEKIESPFIDEADIMLQLSKTSDGIVAKKTICEAGLCNDEEIPFNKIALDKFGNSVFINMVALGRILKAIGINIEKINLEQNLPPKFIDKNVEAIRFGYTYLG